MPNKLYKFTFSPPARLAWLAAKIYKVPTDIIDIDLSRAGQFDSEFLKINPKHEVPAFVHDDEYITESRAIAKYFHEFFNNAGDLNDHWYPSDPDQRKIVDEWLDWSDKRHMIFCMPPLLYATSTYGMPWRETYGIIMAIMGYKVKNDKKYENEMKDAISEAETILSQRKIREIEDLNLGDLAVFLESTLAFSLLPEIRYADYPAFENLYKVILKIPEYKHIEEEFINFIQRVHHLRLVGSAPTLFTYVAEIWTSIKFIAYVTWNRVSMAKL